MSGQRCPWLLVLKFQYEKCKKIMGALQAWQEDTKFGYCHADVVRLSLLCYLFVHCLLCIFLCLVFAQCLAQTSPVCTTEWYTTCNLLILEEVETSSTCTHTHRTYLPGCFNVFYRYKYLEEFQKMYLHSESVLFACQSFPHHFQLHTPFPCPIPSFNIHSSRFLENVWKLVSD